MKVLLFKDNYEKIKESGVGKAIKHQEIALKKAGVDFTDNPKEDFDLVHINTIFPKSYFFAKKALKKGKKVVYHAHSTKEDFKNSFLFSNALAGFFKWWITKCYKTSTLILTPTNYSKKLIESYGIKKEIYPISNGIDLEFWQNKKAYADEFDKKFKSYGKKVIVSVGLYIKRKGILDFVELAKRLPQYEFYWFGYLDLKLVPKEVKNAVQTELPNLHFPGYVDRNFLRSAYARANLFFFPTYEETEGIVLLEALAMKTDSLIRDIEIYRDIKDGEEIYKAKDIDGFEEKICGIIEKTLPSLREQGYKLVEKNSIEATGDKLKTYYERALKL